MLGISLQVPTVLIAPYDIGKQPLQGLSATTDESEQLYTEAYCEPMSSLNKDEGHERYEHHPEEQAFGSESCNPQAWSTVI